MPRKDQESGLAVYFREDPAGRLWLDERNRFVFRYDKRWLQNEGAIPLSVSLPLREKPYADAHAKNLAILYTMEGPRLAPFYDIMCTQVYPGLSDRLAMRIGGENRPTWIQSRHFERLGREVGIKSRLIERIVDDMSKKILPTADAVAQDFAKAYNDCAVVEKILDVIKNNNR